MGFSGRMYSTRSSIDNLLDGQPVRAMIMCLVFACVNGMLVPIMNGAHEKETERHLWFGKTGTRLKSRGCSRHGPTRMHIYLPTRVGEIFIRSYSAPT